MEVKKTVNTDLISVIIPVYNVEKYLAECVESVLNQTYQNLEIILIDDGSPDKCPEMCDEYARKDPRVRVIHKKNGGLSDARNAGIAVAEGKYLSFIDSDDYLTTDMIQALYERAEQEQADVTICGFEKIDENGGYIRMETLEIGIYDRDSFWDYYALHPVACIIAMNKLYRRDVFKGLRYAKNRIHEDEIILTDIVEKCHVIATTSYGKYMYRQRSGSIMHTEAMTFTLANFQIVEERLKRVDYFLERNRAELAKRMIYRAFDVLKIGYVSLDFSEQQIRREYRKQVNGFKEKLKKVGRKKFSFVQNISFVILLTLPANKEVRNIVRAIRDIIKNRK